MRQSVFFFLSFILLVVGCSSLEPARVSEASMVISAEQVIEQDSAVQVLTAPYRSRMEAEMNEVIGTTKTALRRGRPESTLGNMVADILLAEAEKQLGQSFAFALANAGGLRIPEVPAGPLTRRTIYELLPFDNRVVVVTLTGRTVQQLADHMARQGGWPVSESFRMVIDGEAAQQVRVNGQPINPEKEYRVVMPDYVANGGSDSFFLVDLPQEDTGAFMRDVVIAYIKEKTAAGELLHFAVDGRVQRIP